MKSGPGEIYSKIGASVPFVPGSSATRTGRAAPPTPPSSPYEGKLVRRRGVTAEDQKVYIVRDGAKHWITDGRWILANGFRWPNDVHVITPAEFDRIPLGDAINWKP